MRMLTTSNRRAVARLIAVDRARDPDMAAAAASIVRSVRRGGDRALDRWRRSLGETGPLEVSGRELRRGWAATPPGVRRAIRTAIRHLVRVSTAQLPAPFVVSPIPGVRIRQRVEPLARVGCYVPAGRHPLPSTLVMTVVPARVAGVPEIVVACPRPSPEILCAALEAGATRVLRMGGAHAIAALAYGTARVARVDKIVGPGNAWVSAAKAMVAGDCAVDAHAGPSEIVVIGDDGDVEIIASDLVAQAEHDPDARAVFVTTQPALALAVREAVRRRAARLPVARAALRRNGAVVVARDRHDAVALVNALAPEHAVCAEARTAAEIRTAGTIFVGRWSAQAVGDYCTGSNHVLPTGGAARARGGLSAADFVRTCSVQTLTRKGLLALAPAALLLAGAEGLEAHAESIRVRLRVARRPTMAVQRIRGGR